MQVESPRLFIALIPAQQQTRMDGNCKLPPVMGLLFLKRAKFAGIAPFVLSKSDKRAIGLRFVAKHQSRAVKLARG
jgi:hypothetical protein